jgi:acyl-CoA synthetase (AMP-forming)/AMP-acid ligase II
MEIVAIGSRGLIGSKVTSKLSAQRRDVIPASCRSGVDQLPANGAVTAAELRHFLGDHVPGWHLPQRWTFIDEVPRRSIGKFDKKAVRSRNTQRLHDVISCHD